MEQRGGASPGLGPGQALGSPPVGSAPSVEEPEPVTVQVQDDGASWSRIRGEFERRLPLRQLFWQATGSFARGAGTASASSGQSLRTIPCLEVGIRPFSFDPAPRSLAQQSACLLHLFFTSCEDVEFYRSGIRRIIQDWHGVVSKKYANAGIEYLIVHVPRNGEASGARAKNGMGIFSLGLATGAAAVLEKLKADFPPPLTSAGVPGRERVLQLRLNNPSPQDEEQAWAFFFSRVKEAILASFSATLQAVEEDARRLDSQRLVPGWNYCQYFILKESIALTFERMGMAEEALLHYEELEAEFFQTMSEQGAPWFKRFGATDPGDDSASILDLSRKRYRDAIISSAIAIFDFRIYLFARQAHLLRKLGPLPFLRKASAFITGFAATLREYERSLVPLFHESWVWSAYTRVLEYCDSVLATESPGSKGSMAGNSEFQRLRAEMTHRARAQLDLLGHHFGHLTPHATSLQLLADQCEPLPPPASFPLASLTVTGDMTPGHIGDSPMDGPGKGEEAGAGSSSPASPMDAPILSSEAPLELAITRPVLVRACQERAYFDGQYVQATRAAISAYQLCPGRARTLSWLHADLAYLAYLRGRFDEALELWEAAEGGSFASASAGSSPASYSPLALFLPHMALCALQLQQHRKFVRTCCRYFCALNTWPAALLPGMPDAPPRMFAIFQAACHTLPLTLCPMRFEPGDGEDTSLDVLSDYRLVDLHNELGDDQGCVAALRLVSHFPLPVRLERVRLTCSEATDFALDGEEVEATGGGSRGGVLLVPGPNRLCLHRPSKCKAGMYAASRMELDLEGGITLVHVFPPDAGGDEAYPTLHSFQLREPSHAVEVAVLALPLPPAPAPGSPGSSLLDVSEGQAVPIPSQAFVWTITPRFHPLLQGSLQLEIPCLAAPAHIVRKLDARTGEQILVPCPLSLESAAAEVSSCTSISLPDCRPGEQLEFTLAFDRATLPRPGTVQRLPIHLTYSTTEGGRARTLHRVITCNASGDPKLRARAGGRVDTGPPLRLGHRLELDASAAPTLALTVEGGMAVRLLDCAPVGPGLAELLVPADVLCLAGQRMTALFVLDDPPPGPACTIHLRYQLLADVVDAQLCKLLHRTLTTHQHLGHAGYFFKLKERVRERIDLPTFAMTHGSLARALQLVGEQVAPFLEPHAPSPVLASVAQAFLDAVQGAPPCMVPASADGPECDTDPSTGSGGVGSSSSSFTAFPQSLTYEATLDLPACTVFVEMVAATSGAGARSSGPLAPGDVAAPPRALVSATLGSPVPFCVRFSPLPARGWAAAAAAVEGAPVRGEEMEVEYAFDMTGRTWLLQGKARGRLTLRGEPVILQVQLIPLLAGALGLPTLTCTGPCQFLHASDQLLVLPRESATFLL